MVYRPFRFVLWKSVEDAESGSQPYLQLIVSCLLLILKFDWICMAAQASVIICVTVRALRGDRE